MSASLRKNLKKGLLQVVIWITLIAMVLTASMTTIVDGIIKIFGLHNYVVSVNGYGVTPEEFLEKKNEARQKIEMIKKQFGPYAEQFIQMSGMKLDPQQIAINDIAQGLLLDIIVRKYKISLDEKYVHQALIKQLPKEFVDEYGNIDQQALANLLQELHIANFDKKIKEALKRNIVNELINSAVFVPNYVIENKFQDSYSLKRYSILTFSFKKYLDQVKKEKVSKEELAKFFHDNKDKYSVPEKREATVWKFNLTDYGIKITQAEVEKLYNANKAKYIEEPVKVEIKRILLKFQGKNPSDVRQKATQIKTELVQNPSKFDELAKENSDDITTAAKGGLVGFVSKGQLDPALEEAIFALESDGAITDVIRTEEGLEVVQRVSRKAPKYKSLKDVEANLKKEALNKKFNSLFNAEIKRIIKEAKKDISKLEQFAEIKKAKKENLNLAKDDKSPIAPRIFKLSADSLGFLIQGDTAYVYKLDKIEKSYLSKLDSISNKVEEDLYKDKAKKVLEKDLEKAKITNKSFKDIGDEFNAILTVTPFINTENSVDIEKLNKQNFPMSEILEIHKKNNIRIFFGSSDNGYLAKVDDIQPAVTDVEKKKALEKDLYLEHRNNLEKGFIASLAKTAKIKVNINEINKTTRQYEI